MSGGSITLYFKGEVVQMKYLGGGGSRRLPEDWVEFWRHTYGEKFNDPEVRVVVSKKGIDKQYDLQKAA